MLNGMAETAEPLVPDWSLMGLLLIAGVVLFVGALISIARNRTYSSGGTVVWALIVLASASAWAGAVVSYWSQGATKSFRRPAHISGDQRGFVADQ